MRIFILAFTVLSCQAALENCHQPTLENGFFVPDKEIYEHGVKVFYSCNMGLKPALKKWWGEIKCTHGQWSHTPECIDNTWCIPPRVPNAQPVKELRSSYPPGEISFNCDSGFEFIQGTSKARCTNGTWTLPECKRKSDSCDPPPRVSYGMITTPYKNVYENRETLEYVCADGYVIQGDKVSRCERGKWSSNPSCIPHKTSCDTPRVPNARHTTSLKHSYNNGDTVRFECYRGYKFEGTDSAQCVDGTWELPVCKETLCTAPSVPNGRPNVYTLHQYYRNSAYVNFVCNEGYEFVDGIYYAQCVDGYWTLPVCQKLCAAPSVLNAQPAEYLDGSYRPGRFVSFRCDNGYVFVGGISSAQCIDGYWKLPVCKRPEELVCGVPNVPHAHPAGVLTRFYAPGRTVRFECDIGYEFEGSQFAECVQGTWKLPVCNYKVENCGSYPRIENGDVTALPGGTELKVQCQVYYKLQGPERIKCVEQKWTELPVCKPPCKLDRNMVVVKEDEEYLPEGEEKRIKCRLSHIRTVRCTNGKAEYGDCEFEFFG